MTRPRAHHYLPIFYLKGFTSLAARNRNWLYVYEQGKPVRKSKPHNEAHQRDFYSFKDERGDHWELEETLSQIESVVAPLFRSIEKGYYDFHPDDWRGLAYFIAQLWVRGPTGRDFVNWLSAKVIKSVAKKDALDEKEFERKYEEFKTVTGTTATLSAKEMRSFILSNDWEVEQKSYGYTLRKMFEGAQALARILETKRWDVCVSQGDNYFCTSDFPVITALRDKHGGVTLGSGFDLPGVRVFFPVSRSKCLRLWDQGTCGGITVSGPHVREINKFLMVAARRFLYASEKSPTLEALFNKIGCKSVPGKNAFMPSPEAAPPFDL